MAKPKKAAQVKLTYTGDLDAIDYEGYHLPRGEAVEVDEAIAKRFVDHPSFDVEGVTPDDPAASTSTEDALEAERKQHAADLEAAKADYARQLEETTASLKAGWEEQHAADQAEIARLNGLLNPPQQQG